MKNSGLYGGKREKKKRKKSEIAPTTPVEPIDLDEMMDEQEKDSSFPPFDMALFLKNNVQVQIPPEIFLNEDILHRIFEHFDLQPGSRNVAQTRKDLLSAAKTCRAFVEPALNSLWRIIPSLLPLLLLLPSAKVKNGHYFVDELPLDDGQPSGWRRLDRHARRVRILYMEPLRVVISPNIYLRIHAMHDSPLLPGLNKIYIPDHPSPVDLSPALFLALGSTLDMVQLHSYAISDPQFFAPFLSSLHVKSPGLTQLALYGVVNAPLKHIYRFTKLQSLELKVYNFHLQPQLLQKLGELGHLLDLTIDTGTSSIQPHTTPPPTGHSKFTKLRKLKILGTVSLINSILSEMEGLPSLTTLEIDELWDGWTNSTTENSWRCCFEVISTFSVVENIEITPRNQSVLSASCLFPLFKLDNVISFVINLKDAALSGSDDDFRLLAGAFPKLKKLVVSEPPSSLLCESTGRTLACLYHFSQECPDLREIKICLSSDASDNLGAINKIPHPIVRNHRHPLEKLDVHSEFGQLEPTQLIQIARFLDLIFPNLLTSATHSSDTDEVVNWAGIQEFRLALQDARINAPSVI